MPATHLPHAPPLSGRTLPQLPSNPSYILTSPLEIAPRKGYNAERMNAPLLMRGKYVDNLRYHPEPRAESSAMSLTEMSREAKAGFAPLWQLLLL